MGEIVLDPVTNRTWGVETGPAIPDLFNDFVYAFYPEVSILLSGKARRWQVFSRGTRSNCRRNIIRTAFFAKIEITVFNCHLNFIRHGGTIDHSLNFSAGLIKSLHIIGIQVRKDIVISVKYVSLRLFPWQFDRVPRQRTCQRQALPVNRILTCG